MELTETHTPVPVTGTATAPRGHMSAEDDPAPLPPEGRHRLGCGELGVAIRM